MENLTTPFLEYHNLLKPFNLLVTTKLIVLGLWSFSEEVGFFIKFLSKCNSQKSFKVACSKLTIETLEYGVKYVQIEQ